MADVKNKRVNIYIDQAAAEQALESLQRTADKLTKSIDAGRAAGKNMAKDIAKLGDTKAAIAGVQNQIDKGLRPSFAQTQAAVNKLRNELRRMSEDAPGYADKFKAYKKATAELDRMRTSLNGVEKAQKSMGIGFAVFAATIATQVVGSLARAAGAVFDLRVQMDESVQNLSAITGAAGADLEFLKKAAIDLSKESNKSAVEYVEAMKLIGSAKPELLSQKEALVGVTAAAKLLSEASGLELPDAAKRLTDALNQFGADASQATAYVDALAAASKFGAAEVPEVTEALLKFGAVAKSSNIDIYESAGAIELLAEKGLKGAEAGTALRNVFLKLSAVDALPKEAQAQLKAAGINTDLLSDKTRSLQERLTELSKIQNNTTALIKIFGAENVVAGQTILANIPRYAELTNQIKEQGVASEQAAANTDTLSFKWEKFKNVLASIFIDGSNSPLKRAVEFLTDGVTGLVQAIENINTKLLAVKNRMLDIYSVAGKLLQLDFTGAAAQAGINKAVNQSAIQRKKDAEDIANITHQSEKIVQDAGTKTLEQQKRLLASEKALLNAAINRRNELINQGRKKGDAALDNATNDILLSSKNVKGLSQLVNPATGTVDAGALPGAKASTDKAAERARKKEESEKERLLKQLNDFQFDLQQLGKKSDEKEIDRITKKYDELIKQAAKHGIDYINLEKEKNRAIAYLIDVEIAERKKKAEALFIDTAKDEYKNALVFSQDYFDELKNKEGQRYADGITSKKEYEDTIKLLDSRSIDAQIRTAENYQKAVEQAADDVNKFKKQKRTEDTADAIRNAELLKDIERRTTLAAAQNKVASTRPNTQARLEAQRELLNVEREQALTSEALVEAEKENIRNAYREKETELVIAFYQQQVEMVIGYIQQGLQIISQFNDARSAKEKTAFEKELRQNEQKKQSIRRLEESKVISAQEARRRITVIEREEDAKKAELEKKQAERQRKMAMTQALINGALAITNIWATTPKADFGVSTYIMLALSALATIASVTKIASQQFARGGKVLGHGKINTAPNIPTQSNGDNVLATVRTGEVILNESQQAALGGADTFRRIGVPGFAGGGSVRPFWERRPYQSINYPAVHRAMRFAGGGLVGGGLMNEQETTRPQGQLQPIVNRQDGNIEQTLTVLSNTIQNLQQQLALGIEANVSLAKLDAAEAQRDRIKQDAELK